VKKPVHFNIRIEGNTFKTFDYPVLYAKSTRGLVFKNNQIIRTKELTRSRAIIICCVQWLLGCGGSGLKLEGEVLGQNIRLENMPKSNLKLSGSPELTFE
jgi:hypothetical protein